MTFLLVSWQHPFARTFRSRRAGHFTPCLRTPTQHHQPGPNQAIVGRSSGQSVVISTAKLTAISAKLPPATAAPAPNPHRRPSFHRLPAGSSIGGFRTPDLLPGSIAHARPASETLPDTGRMAPMLYHGLGQLGLPSSASRAGRPIGH
jgi:hypothetical protein